MKELQTPTKQQIIHRNRLWVKALRDNKRKNRESMRDCKGGRCCLAVAEDVAISCGLPISKSEHDASFPVDAVGNFFGWNESPNGLQLIIPRKNEDGEYFTEDADVLNDGLHSSGNGCEYDGDSKSFFKGLSHAQIAECVENTYVHPSKKEWSFEL